jgi:hypothetical protein
MQRRSIAMAARRSAKTWAGLSGRHLTLILRGKHISPPHRDNSPRISLRPQTVISLMLANHADATRTET